MDRSECFGECDRVRMLLGHGSDMAWSFHSEIQNLNNLQCARMATPSLGYSIESIKYSLAFVKQTATFINQAFADFHESFGWALRMNFHKSNTRIQFATAMLLNRWDICLMNAHHLTHQSHQKHDDVREYQYPLRYGRWNVIIQKRFVFRLG